MSDEKRCSNCGGSGPFHKNRSRPDGLTNECRKCRSDRLKNFSNTPVGRAVRMWSGILRRAWNADGKNRWYADVENRMTKQEFINWAAPAVAEFEKKNPGAKPSIDRIDSRGHYELSNLRIISFHENYMRRERNKNVNAPAGKAWCGTCKQYKDHSSFSKNVSRANGLDHQCKACVSKTKRGRARRTMMAAEPHREEA